jgi:GTPase KRas protein
MLEVLDTAGQEEYIALREQWIRDGEGFILVYSISSRSSFTRISRFHNQIQRVKEASASPSYPGSPVASLSYIYAKMPPMMLVGNNSERVTEREVSAQEGYTLARELGCDFVEASAKNCINVEKAFYDVVRRLRQERMEGKERIMVRFRTDTQGYRASRLSRQAQKKPRGVSQVWRRVRPRVS